jgi:hypothetical protein
MKNEEFNAEQMLILLQLVRVAKDEVHEALDYRDEEGVSVPMGSRPAFVLSREYEALQDLQKKLLAGA